MVQFLSIIFFFGFLQFLLGFSKFPYFWVILYITRAVFVNDIYLRKSLFIC